MRRVLGLIFLTDVAILGVVAYLVSKPIRFEKTKYFDIESYYPLLSKTMFNNDEWKGIVFKGINAKFRVLYMRSNDSKNSFLHLKNSEKIKSLYKVWDIDLLGEKGIYGVNDMGKGYYIVALFPFDGAVYWFDLSTSSSEDKYKSIVDKFLTNLKIGERKVNARKLKDELDQIKIPFSMMQPAYFIVLLLAGILLFTFFVVYFIFNVGGRKPLSIPAESIKLEENDYCSVKRGAKTVNIPCSLILTSKELIIYSFKKKYYSVDLSESHIRLEKGKIIIDGKEGIKIIIYSSHPDEWRPYFHESFPGGHL